MNMKKSVAYIVIILILGMSIYKQDVAAGSTDFITTIRVEAGKEAAGEYIEIYRVAQWDENTERYTWEEAYDEAISKEEVQIEETKEFITRVLPIAKEQSPVSQMELDENGQLSFEADPGVYLLLQQGEVAGSMQPLLIGLPQTNAEGDGWEKEVVLYPKYAPQTENPDTGDTRLVFFGGMGILSGMGMICLCLFRRKRERSVSFRH